MVKEIESDTSELLDSATDLKKFESALTALDIRTESSTKLNLFESQYYTYCALDPLLLLESAYLGNEGNACNALPSKVPLEIFDVDDLIMHHLSYGYYALSN